MGYEVKDGFVLVPVTVWEEIEEDLNLLSALQGAGVDNWEGYDFAIQSLPDAHG
jgi:hypothetical protein